MQLVSPVNPPQTTVQHDKSCRSPLEDEVEELLDGDADDGEQQRTSKRRHAQNAMTQYMPSAQKQDQVHRSLASLLDPASSQPTTGT